MLVRLVVCCRYRSVAERMLGAQLSHSRDDMSRILSLDFLNRQLVWRELSDLLLFVLPLLHSLKDRRDLSCRSTADALLTTALPCESSSFSRAFTAKRATSRIGSGDPAVCESCGRALVLRCAALPCGHRGCYFCLAAACRSNSQHGCSVCSTRVVALRRA